MLHIAFGETYDKLGALLDELVETHQGKHQKIVLSGSISIELSNMSDLNIESILGEVTDYLSTEFAQQVDETKDTDCLNIRDEILQTLNKLKYLLTLK